MGPRKNLISPIEVGLRDPHALLSPVGLLSLSDSLITLLLALSLPGVTHDDDLGYDALASSRTR